MNLFESLLIAHFIGDWMLQNNWMAMNKTKVIWVRALHCLIYSACFFWLPFWWIAYIFVTHFIIDSYKPLYWFRRLKGDFKNMDEFIESFNTPAGFYVNVTLDQIFHILTFLPLVYYKL